jgi:hypothetical protein
VTGVRFCFPAARRMEKKKVKRSIDKFPPPLDFKNCENCNKARAENLSLSLFCFSQIN